MDLQEASLSMALLMQNEKKYYDENLNDTDSYSIEELHKKVKEFEWVKSNTREFGNQLAANPNFFGVMESWKVYILGTEGVNKKSIMEAHSKNNIEDLLEKCGSMAISIKNYLQDRKHMICDMSAGMDGWDIAIRCTDNQSRDLCQEMYKRFNHAINLKLISLSRRFAGHCLPGLYNWEDAEKFLKIYGI